MMCSHLYLTMHQCKCVDKTSTTTFIRLFSLSDIRLHTWW